MMAGETRPSGTPGTFINDIEDGVRQDYAARLEAARKQVREATDRADAERICAQQANADTVRRMAEYRRGRWYDVGAVVAGAGIGFVTGYQLQKQADLRVSGAPVMMIAGLPGIAAGALLDEHVVTRAVFAVGGTMYMVGALTYALVHPQSGSGGQTGSGGQGEGGMP
jgi:hypothetical protein